MIEDLAKLIDIAKKNKITHLKVGEIEFTIQLEADDTPIQVPDLKADDLMSMDKILHWSSEGPEGDMPLTGEGNG